MQNRTMPSRKREWAKFFSGVAVMQTIIHGALWASNVRFTLFGVMDYTPQLNAVATFVWLVVSFALIAYAWGGGKGSA